MLRLFDVNGRDMTDELDYCSNPSYLGEPWCSAWGICKAQEPVEQAMELETRHGLQSESSDDNIYSELKSLLQNSGPLPHSSSIPGPGPAHSSSTPAPPAPPLPLYLTSLQFHPMQAKPPACKKQRQFAVIKSDREVEDARAFGIPENTRKDTKYCHGLWVEWTMYM